MSFRLGVAFAIGLSGATMAGAEVRLMDWAELHGWAEDDHSKARAVFNITCGDMKAEDWPTVCGFAAEGGDARVFFETFFRPVLITNEDQPLFTGYFEPELLGSREKTARFRFPLYRFPDDVPNGEPWLTRREIETSIDLEERGLDIVWVEDPVEKFFLQIQGSGRIKLQSGETVRVGYGGKNGHNYRSVGVELVRRGLFEEHQVSAETIKNWVRDNPREGRELLWHNPSYVFFREVSDVPAERGPLGAMNRSLTPGRTVAVDPDYVPMGAPVWIEKDGKQPIHRLMVAQDTGSAIKGPQRADIFFGTGDEAGDIAGQTKDRGRMIVLLPLEDALELTGGS